METIESAVNAAVRKTTTRNQEILYLIRAYMKFVSVLL